MSPELRIGDAERERAAGQLAEHYAAGRITQEEHGERLDRIWAARTQSEIAPAFADLPGPDPQPAPPSAPRSGTRPRRPVPGPRLPLPLPLAAVLGVLGVVAVLAHLPLVLVGLGVWFLLARGGCGSRAGWGHPRRW